jgi:hypothetical protein
VNRPSLYSLFAHHKEGVISPKQVGYHLSTSPGITPGSVPRVPTARDLGMIRHTHWNIVRLSARRSSRGKHSMNSLLEAPSEADSLRLFQTGIGPCLNVSVSVKPAGNRLQAKFVSFILRSSALETQIGQDQEDSCCYRSM